MFKVVPISNVGTKEEKKGKPLHATLATAAPHRHFYHRWCTKSFDESRDGVILTIGTEDCDVSFPGALDHRVEGKFIGGYTIEKPRLQLKLRLIIDDAVSTMVQQKSSGGGPRTVQKKFMRPRSKEEQDACQAALDGIAVVVEKTCDTICIPTYIYDGGAITMRAKILRAAESCILRSLSLPSNDEVASEAKYRGPVAVASGVEGISFPVVKIRFGTAEVHITRIPINICPVRFESADARTRIEKLISPVYGTALADSQLGVNSTPYHPLLARTHLLVPSEPTITKASMRSMSAWCLKMPVISNDFLLALTSREKNSDPLPDIDAFSRPVPSTYSMEETGGEDAASCSGMRDPLKGFLFLSLVPSETEGLVLAAGAAIYRTYYHDDKTFFDGDWLNWVQTAGTCVEATRTKRARSFGDDPACGVIVCIDASPRRKDRAKYLKAGNIPFVLPCDIIAAINKMKGSIFDTTGKEILGRGDIPSALFRHGWQHANQAYDVTGSKIVGPEKASSASFSFQRELQHATLDLLPEDSLRRIFVDYLEGQTANGILSLFRLASCNKAMKKCVYRDSPFLWTNIDLGAFEYKMRRRIKDKHLDALLRNVNAVEVTKRLSLYECRGVKGSGLRSLFGSTTLEEIDLRFCGGNHSYLDPIPDADNICFILRSMPPFVAAPSRFNELIGVKVVMIDSYAYPRIANTRVRNTRHDQTRRILEVQAELGSKLARASHCTDCQVWMGGCILAACSEVTTDQEEEDAYLSSQARRSVCFECKDILCQNTGCRQVQECTYCKKQLCEDCVDEMRPNSSIETFMQPCRQCNKQSCCDDFMEYCVDCHLAQCESCENGSSNIMYWFCAECQVIKCTSCVQFDYCEFCSSHYCSDDDVVIFCAECNAGICEGVCKESHGFYCSSCDNNYCNDSSCISKVTCRNCDEDFCGSDCLAAFCEGCEVSHFCAPCIEAADGDMFSNCASCGEARCNHCTEYCPVDDCGEVLCEACIEKLPNCQMCSGVTCCSHRFECSMTECNTIFCQDHATGCPVDDCGEVLCEACIEELPTCQMCSGAPCNSCVVKCSMTECNAVFCTTCVGKEDDACKEALRFDLPKDHPERVSSEICGKCYGVQCDSPSCTSLVCCGCVKEGKLPLCSGCGYQFCCWNGECDGGGKSIVHCTGCGLYFHDNDECREGHKNICSSGHSPRENYWHEELSNQVNARMKHLYKHRSYYLNYYDYALLDTHSIDEFAKLPLGERLAHAEKMYAAVKRKDGRSVKDLDIGPPSAQPRMEKYYKKK